MDDEAGGARAPIEFCTVCKKDKAACRSGRRTVRIGPVCNDAPAARYAPVPIPDAQAFLRQWFPWVKGKVRKRFKRDHDRIPDTVQRVCARLLQKEFTARWFFKHLKDDLVTRTEAERILGHGFEYPSPRSHKGKVVRFKTVELKFSNPAVINPVVGLRTDPGSLWSVADVLAYGKFDFERYFYSAQGHTIDSDKMLRLLGHAPGEYWKLLSLWRQDRILPAELTEHECPRGRPSREGAGVGNKPAPSTCPECARGLALLRSKGISLASSDQCPSWKHPGIPVTGPDGKPVLGRDGGPAVEDVQAMNPALSPATLDAIRKMRWNDSQLLYGLNGNFLRRWQDKNEIYCQPRFIMRPAKAGEDPHGVDAGLLKYADRIVENEVINEFKHLGRTDDMAKMVYNNGVSPEATDSEAVAFDPDSEEGAQKIVCDVDAVADFRSVEHRSDITSLLGEADLSAEESDVIAAVSLMDVTVRDYARTAGIPVQRAHRLHTSAMKKLRSATVGSGYADRVMDEVCERHDCSRDQVLGTSLVGRAVVARADLFATLYAAGMSEEDMASHFRYPRDRVSAAVARGRRPSKDLAL